MAHRTWLQISILLPVSFHDLLVGQLADLGFEGFQQEDRALLCFVSTARWSPRKDARLAELLSRFKKEFPSCDLALSRRIIRERNWNARWEQSAGIVEATRHIVIKPRWKSLRKKDKGKIVLHIDPKMSFGTGHHETTRLCLALLESSIKQGDRVLDAGCGTGILAIASVKLGASKAVGIDADDWAVLNARENVRSNRATAKVAILKRNVLRLPAGRFDLILSNIDLPTNLRLLPALRRQLKSDGTIIVSGVLTSDFPKLLGTITTLKLSPVELIEENEWLAVAIKASYAHQRH